MTAVLAHELPCRIRFRVECLKHDRRRAERLRDRIAALPGVVAADASPLTGSLIVNHDGQVATRKQITAALEVCGHSVRAEAGTLAPAATRTGDAQPRVHPLFRILAETLLERLLQTALAAVI